MVCARPIVPSCDLCVHEFGSYAIHLIRHLGTHCRPICGLDPKLRSAFQLWSNSHLRKGLPISLGQTSLQSHVILYMFEAHSLRTDLGKFTERWHTQPAQLCCRSCDSNLHVRCFAMVSHRTSLLTIEESRTFAA